MSQLSDADGAPLSLRSVSEDVSEGTGLGKVRPMSRGLAPAGAFELSLAVRPDARELAAVRGALGRLAIPAWREDDARLLVNELVTNSIRHSGLSDGRIRVRARVAGKALHEG